MDINEELIQASRELDIAEVRRLIERGASVNYKDSYSGTPLHIACREGHTEIVTLLVENKADVQSKNKDSDTPLHIACREGHAKIVTLLVENKADVQSKNKYDDTALYIACRNRHTEVVTILVENKADVQSKNIEGDTPLHIAIKVRNTKIVTLLVENKADVQSKNKKGDTPLHIACRERHTKIVTLLVENKADVQSKNKDRDTALHIACREWFSEEIVTTLVENKADVQSKTKDGDTALHIACREGLSEIVTTLVENKADVQSKTKDGDTALHIACREGLSEIVTTLVENKADVQSKTKGGDTALHIACRVGHTEIVKILVENKADVQSKNNDGDTPLHLACRQCHTEIVKILVGNNADVQSKNHDGDTPLHLACRQWRTEIVKILVENNADVQSKNHDGDTPLHFACRLGHTEVVKILVENNADVQSKNNSGQKPFDLTKDLKSFPKKYSAIPAEIRGAKAKDLFRRALRKGQVRMHHIRLMTVGHFGVGKTTVTKALLLDTESLHTTASTDGIEVHVERCRINLDNRKWEKTNLDPRKTMPIRQKIQQILYEERRRELLEEKDTSFNPFAKNFVFRTKVTKEQLQEEYQKKENQESRASFESNKAETSKQTSEENVDEKSSVNFTFQSSPEDDSKKTAQPRAYSKVTSDNAKQFISKEKDLLPAPKEDLKKFDETYCEVEIWDFGGQSAFYTTHQTFLSPRCIYTLVIDGSKDLDDEVEDEELIPGQHNSKRCGEFTRFWIVSIITYAKGRVRGFPKIIPVFTHMDKIREDQRQERIRNILAEIQHICAEHNAEDHLILDPRLNINAMNPKDEGYAILREVILDVAKTYPDWAELVPAYWVPLEYSIMMMKAAGYKILPVSCLCEMNKESELQALEDDELGFFLQFQHDIGNILYFTDSQLCNNIILHPKWLVDALRTLITADRFLQVDTRKKKMLENLSSSGILHCSLLEQIWNDSVYKEFLNNADHLLKTMEKMDLLAVPMSYDNDGQVEQGQQFIVPSMVKKLAAKSLIDQLNPTSDSACILFTFHGNFLPKAIYTKLIASCINIWPLENLENKNVLCSGFCSFQPDVNHRISIRMLSYQILAVITAINQKKAVSQSLCRGAKQLISSDLSRICQIYKHSDDELGEENEEKFHIEIPCCLEHLQCVQKLSQEQTAMISTCVHHRGKEDDINVRVWISETLEERPKEIPYTVNNPCPDLKDLSLSIKELGRLSNRLYGSEKSLSIALEVDDRDLTNEKDDYNKGRMGLKELYFRILRKADAHKSFLTGLVEDLCLAYESNRHVVCQVIRRRNTNFESSLKEEFMFNKPSEKFLDELSSRIPPKDAFLLFIELGLDVNEIDRAAQDFSGNVLKQIRHILKTWQRKTEPRATFRILEEAMLEVGVSVRELGDTAPHIVKTE